jgi:hypothetical protein
VRALRGFGYEVPKGTVDRVVSVLDRDRDGDRDRDRDIGTPRKRARNGDGVE